MSCAVHASFRRFALAACFIAAAPVALAAGTSTASGTLTVKGENKPLSVKLAHAYYLVGPDQFDESRTVRSIVFTASDQHEAIESCRDVGCANISGDGLWVGLNESGMTEWWAHVSPMQFSSVATSALKLDVDTPEHMAGTFKLGGAADSGVTVDVRFDATLVKTFPKTK
jgi:hypothetical protein